MPPTKESASTGTEIIRLDQATVEKALMGQIAENQSIEIEDPAEVTRSIVARILASPDADAVLGGNTPIGGRECLGRPIELRDVRWHRSSFEGDVPVFAVLDVVFLDDGEPAAVTTGSVQVMAQAYQLQRLGALPCPVKFTESEKETAAGFRPQWLVRA